MLRIPHYPDNRLKDGGKVVNPTHRPHFTLQKYYFAVSATYFYERLSEPQALVRPEVLGKFKKIILLFGSRIRDFPACSTVP
jgi:hypothetical protein